MKKKRIPDWISSQLLRRVLQSKIATYGSYWVFQGMLYMDIRETAVKCFLDAFVTCLLVIVFSMNLFVGFVIAHTLNMFFNGHFFAMRRHMGLGANKAAPFVEYVEQLHRRINSKPYIAAAAAYGSLSKNVYSSTSDIDLRIVPAGNGLDFFHTCLFALCERTKAFLSRFPLDLYTFDMLTLQKKMNSRETPIVFADPKGILSQIYPERVRNEDFFRAFRVAYVDKE